MKRLFAYILSLALLLSLVACGGQTSPTEIPDKDVNQLEQPAISNDSTTKPPVSAEQPASSYEVTTVPSVSSDESNDSSFSINIDGISTLDELEDRIDEHLTNLIDSLSLRWKSLSTEIDTYEKYCDNTEIVSNFYQTIVVDTEQMCIMLRDYSAKYARMILDSDMSANDKYDAVDGINKHLYDDACSKIHDEIYEGILDEMHDYYYEGILDDAKDKVDYSEWYDVSSEEYKQWYHTTSKVYGLYYDSASQIYSFYYDMSNKLYRRDFDKAEKRYEKFVQKIAKDKGFDTGNIASNAIFDTTLRSANSIEELENVVNSHVSECVQALKVKWEDLSKDIDTFDKYTKNVNTVEEFHTYIENSVSQILVMICDYGVSYAQMILESDSSTKDQYKMFEDFKDCIYEDACDIVKEEIYEDLLKDIKDYYYEGIIDDAKDSVEYSEWSDARGDAYGWWSDARGDVYSNWSDTRGDLYSFYSDMRSKLYSGDTDKANDKLQEFKDKVAKVK